VRCARNLIRPPLGLCLSGPPFALHCDLPIDSNRHKSSSNINRVSPKGLGIPELSAQRALPMPYRSGPAVTVRGGNLIPFSFAPVECASNGANHGSGFACWQWRQTPVSGNNARQRLVERVTRWRLLTHCGLYHPPLSTKAVGSRLAKNPVVRSTLSMRRCRSGRAS
jgi:hypothetical protein